ncbi:MAG: radical SAM protein [Clostridiales bacterium]|nr:radical SAM protein [Clostridiales bacterium]
MTECFECPIMCGAYREHAPGVCGAGRLPLVARAARHYFEEPPISGTRGSGAIFFTGCNMRCVFCQNIEISRTGGVPGAVPADESALADMMLRLEELGSHNVNLVTPTPHTRVLERAIPLARERGLTVPVVWNTNGYERVETLKRFEGLVDIWLPDLKYVSASLAGRYSQRADYFEFASKAIIEMQRQSGTLELDEDGIAKKGVIIRHLVLPCAVDETRRVLDFISLNFPIGTYISLMSQYTPIAGMKKPLDRRLTKGEYKRAVDYAVGLGFTNVFTQKLSSAESVYTPEFSGLIE